METVTDNKGVKYNVVISRVNPKGGNVVFIQRPKGSVLWIANEENGKVRNLTEAGRR